jgi:adenylyl- and sulfurtransferase ThiI
MIYFFLLTFYKEILLKGENMDIIEKLPNSIKESIINVTAGTLSDRLATRITVDHILTVSEKYLLNSYDEITGVDNICQYRYAPEIKYSYFYILH